MNSGSLSGAFSSFFIGGVLLGQLAFSIFVAAVGAWLAIRFEKWREAKSGRLDRP
ncbi:MAG TPA: hypothetical protein VNZ26_17765 [Vicinamibacterales bacterium]|jgi:hypothetical protein|nr:hypothetical protein [Vicinamibacterales bacterium]